ncbi:MAG: 2Fe-2S iron-sulfur cluster-binding protein [Betaproteobacteria bacterium]
MTWRLPTRRDLRLASGLTLFVYIALHLANHALGLVSVALAEHGLNMAVRVWHSVPGTVVLYGAAATHIALALNAIYRRRTMRMPPVELLRIALGLGIPILLIGHAVATRLAWDAYRLSPEYSRVVWSLWLSDSEGRQLALLVPGWLHGCLGINFAFGRRAWYRRARPVLFAIALLLPVLGGLGFLAMGKELAADTVNREFLDSNAEVDAATRIALARIRDGLVAAWFVLIGAIFVAREARAIVERRRHAVITIAYPQRNARVPAGWTVLEASRSHHIPHMSMCGGQARCSTCRVQVTAGVAHCPPPAAAELATLERIGAPPGVRLACQLRPTGDLSVVPLLAAEAPASGTDHAAAVIERDFALVRVVWCNRAEFARGHLPHDIVFLSGLFVDTVNGSVRAHGGVASPPAASSVTAVFGVDAPLADACRQALAAAASIENELAGLARNCTAKFGGLAEFAILIHAGHGAIRGAHGFDAGPLLTAGLAFDALDAMQDAAVAYAAPLLVSARACAEAGVTLTNGMWRDVEQVRFSAPLCVALLPRGTSLADALSG